MKTLILGIWYPAAAAYGRDYFDSLRMQRDDDFDILIITDGADVPSAFHGHRVIIQQAEPNSTPPEIRCQGIDFAIRHKYDALIFTDCDDYFSHDRVGNAKYGDPDHCSSPRFLHSEGCTRCGLVDIFPPASSREDICAR